MKNILLEFIKLEKELCRDGDWFLAYFWLVVISCATMIIGLLSIALLRVIADHIGMSIFLFLLFGFPAIALYFINRRK